MCRIFSLRFDSTPISSVFVRKLEYFGIFLFLLVELGKSNHVPFQLPGGPGISLPS